VITCFWLEPTKLERVWLRRYVSDSRCSAAKGRIHEARALIGDRRARLDAEGYHQTPREKYSRHRRWPKTCACGHRFAAGDVRQVFSLLLYRRTDTRELITLDDAPPGAMWDAWWMGRFWKGHDGRSLQVVCPDGRHWAIDGPAKNCTLPNDHEHRCWLRTGTPPRITVSKSGPGRTCAAGGGSIDTGTYHGFLQDGRFT